MKGKSLIVFVVSFLVLFVLFGILVVNTEPNREEIRGEIKQALKNCGNYSVRKHITISGPQTPKTIMELTCEDSSTISIKDYIFNELGGEDGFQRKTPS